MLQRSPHSNIMTRIKFQSLCYLVFMLHIHGYSYIKVAKAPEVIPRSVNPVKHVDNFLKNIQMKIKNSRILLQNINKKNQANKNSFIGFHKLRADNHIKQQDEGGSEGVLNTNSTNEEMRSVVHLSGESLFNMISTALNSLLRMGMEDEIRPGDVLYGLIKENLTTTTEDPYEHKLHEELIVEKTGYLSVAFERLCEQIALKKARDVTEVLSHAEFIVEEMRLKRLFHWLEEPMTNILITLSMMASEMPVDELKSYAIMMHFTMVHRHSSISAEVNKMIDEADSFVVPEDGDHLFHVIREFKEFPNVKKSGKLLCADIIHAFGRPFGPIADTKDLKEFVKKANKAFKERYPQFSKRRFDKYRRQSILSGASNIFYGNRRANITIPLAHRYIRRSHATRKRRRRRMNDEVLQAALATRQLVSIKDYNRISRERFTIRKHEYSYTNTFDSYLPTEENVIRQLSIENNNYYREISKEEFGIQKILSENTNEVLNVDHTAQNVNSNYQNKIGNDFTKFITTMSTREINTVPHRFHMANRNEYGIASTNYENRLMTRKLYEPTTRDKISDYLFPQDNDNQEKRYNNINILDTNTRWVDTTKASIQIRRTTQYKKPQIDRYKFFDRRTTELKAFRRANLSPYHVNIDMEKYSQILRNKSKVQEPTTKSNISNTIDEISSVYLNVLNSKYLHGKNNNSRHSGERVYMRVDLLDQLLNNNVTYNGDNISFNGSVEIDDVETVLKRHLHFKL